jgi:3-oxoacyl-[acyl-carrier protein] reductase
MGLAGMEGRDFAQKVALVTGGSRGIGRSCALELARRGASVAITYQSNEAAAQEALERLKSLGARALTLKLELADADACLAAVDSVVEAFGRLDVLVNNAGVAIDGLVMRMKTLDWQRQFDVNVNGAFHLVKAASRPMLKQRSGAIVNLASVVGETGNAGQSAYAASKAALIGFTKAIARELASRNVRVNAVSPGFIETDMTARISGEAREKLAASIPLARLGTADEVARAVAFLASEQASYITGEVLRVNGGLLT